MQVDFGYESPVAVQNSVDRFSVYLGGRRALPKSSLDDIMAQAKVLQVFTCLAIVIAMAQCIISSSLPTPSHIQSSNQVSFA